MAPKSTKKSKAPGAVMAKVKAPAAGYSGTPLVTKLGIKEGHRVAVLGRGLDELPAGMEELPAGVKVESRLRAPAFDVILMFVTKLAELPERFAAAAKALDPAGGLWVSWPKKTAKKASGLATDITEDRVREVALDLGLVDNKVCAVDEVWSGLRCVYRLKDRPPKGR